MTQVFFDVSIGGQAAGRIIMTLDTTNTPQTAENFRCLCTGEKGVGQSGKPLHFKGSKFHRVIPGFMAQGGDPTGTGTGGSDLPDLKAEFNAEPHVRGTCSMARTPNPDSANSQFFICFDDAHFLDGQYTVWGQVESGMEYVDALPTGEPVRDPGKIEKATVA